jgi:hypothetical protein
VVLHGNVSGTIGDVAVDKSLSLTMSVLSGVLRAHDSMHSKKSAISLSCGLHFPTAAGKSRRIFIKRLIAGLNKFSRRDICDSIQDLKSKACPFVKLPKNASEQQRAVTSEVMAECV